MTNIDTLNQNDEITYVYLSPSRAEEALELIKQGNLRKGYEEAYEVAKFLSKDECNVSEFTKYKKTYLFKEILIALETMPEKYLHDKPQLEEVIEGLKKIIIDRENAIRISSAKNKTVIAVNTWTGTRGSVRAA